MTSPVLHNTPVSRRTVLKSAIGAAAIGGMSALLTACGANPATPSAASLEKLAIQLGWIRNVQFAGEYAADQAGYYTDGGFKSVELIAGGPNVSVNNVVVARKALMTLSGCDVTGPAILEGAPLIALGAVRQRNPLCIMSLADNPILEPSDMIGKRIGLQATNETTWNAFLSANDMDATGITIVPAQFDPQPLAAGEVDGWFSFYANEPNSLRVRGFEVQTMLLADHGLPLVSDILVARTDVLAENRDAVKAAIVGGIRGWKDVIADPEYGARLAVEVYGVDLGLDLKEQTLAAADHVSLIVTDDTRTNGLFTITDALLEQSIESLARGGITIAPEKLFDLSVIEEVYSENPTLRDGL